MSVKGDDVKYCAQSEANGSALLSDIRFMRRICALVLTMLLLLSVFVPTAHATVASGSDISSSDTQSASSSDTHPIYELDSVSASSAILVDVGTGKVLFEQNADQPLPPASTTKIMTALLVLEAVSNGDVSLSDVLTATGEQIAGIPWDASSIRPKMQIGESMCVKDLLYCVMLTSDCVSCDILAQHVSGSVEAFVERMNQRALELGCEGVNFKNAHGYPSEGHTATARSLFLITMEAMKHEEFCTMVNSLSYTVSATNKSEERKLSNTNSLLLPSSDYYYSYANGVKTGFTNAAGLCLVTTAEHDNRKLVSVVLGAHKSVDENNKTVYGSFAETVRMLDFGFFGVSWRKIATSGYSVTSIPLSSAKSTSLTLVYSENAYALLRNDLDLQNLQYETKLYTRSATAPIDKGTVFGEVNISYNGELLVSVPLTAGADIPVDNSVDGASLTLVIMVGIVALGWLMFVIKKKWQNNREKYGYDISRSEIAARPQEFVYGEKPLYSRPIYPENSRRNGSGRSLYGYDERPPRRAAEDSRSRARSQYYQNHYRSEDDKYTFEEENNTPKPIFPRQKH